MSEREIGTTPGERLTGQVNVIYGPNAGPDDVPHIDKGMRQMAYQLQSWGNNMRAVTGQSGLFDRGKYVSNDIVYNQMLTARAAVKDDDICASVAELTEGMAFQGLKWESSDWDTTDLFNQMAAEQDLDSLIRKMWREEFTYCVDTATDVLTRRGWLSHDQLTTDDEALTLDPITKQIRFERVQAVNTFDWDGPLERWHSNRFDALSTPGHRWLTESRSGELSFLTTGELSGRSPGN